MTKYLIFISLFLVLGKTHAQFEWSTKKETIIIPFELIHNMIIVDLKFNDTNLKMILDTGASKNLFINLYIVKSNYFFYSLFVFNIF